MIYILHMLTLLMRYQNDQFQNNISVRTCYVHKWIIIDLMGFFLKKKYFISNFVIIPVCS